MPACPEGRDRFVSLSVLSHVPSLHARSYTRVRFPLKFFESKLSEWHEVRQTPNVASHSVMQRVAHPPSVYSRALKMHPNGYGEQTFHAASQLRGIVGRRSDLNINGK